MSNKTTAVEQLKNEFFGYADPYPHFSEEDKWVITEREFLELIEQAKAMEKKQIINARVEPLKLMQYLRDNHGYFGGPDNGSVIQREIDNSEQYYNETYKNTNDEAIKVEND